MNAQNVIANSVDPTVKNKTIFVLLVVAMSVIACTSQSGASSPDPTPILERTPTTVPTIIPTGTPHQLGQVKTYHDEIAGFALDYPAGWFVETDALQGAAESAVYTVSLFSWDRKIATPPSKDLNTLPNGTTKIDITVFNQGPATLAEAVQQFRNQDSGTPLVFLKEETWALANDQEAAYLESESTFGVVATM